MRFGLNLKPLFHPTCRVLRSGWTLLVIGAILTLGCSDSASPTASRASGGTSAGTPVKASVTSNSQAELPALTPSALAEAADVQAYPGAKFPDHKTLPPKKDDAGKLHVYLVMSTPDSAEKVIQYYQTKGRYSLLKLDGGSEQLQGLSPKGNLVLITLQRSSGQTLIEVKSVQGS